MSKAGGETHGKCAGHDVRSQVVGVRIPPAMYGLDQSVWALTLYLRQIGRVRPEAVSLAHPA